MKITPLFYYPSNRKILHVTCLKNSKLPHQSTFCEDKNRLKTCYTTNRCWCQPYVWEKMPACDISQLKRGHKCSLVCLMTERIYSGI